MGIQEAILKQDIDQLKSCLINAPNCIDYLDERSVPMTFLAAEMGNLEMVAYIVEYSRASMNLRDQNHRNILHYAAMSKNVELCQYLVEKVGMSPLEGDWDLQTPFDIAHDIGAEEVEVYFEQYVGCKLSEMYRNPIRSGMFPDPSIIRVGQDYYMVNSSFIYFPCIPISHSKDLIHWKIIGHAITNPEWSNLGDLEGGRGYWAPDISYHDERFYITATYRLNDGGKVYRRQIIVSSQRAEGPYSQPAIIDEDGIDPSLFTDSDGKRYMVLNRGCRILELDSKATRQISKARLLYYGDQKRAPEGPHLLLKDGYYYLFLAEGGTGQGHRISVARSKTLFGNYEACPYNPIMRQEDEKARIQRCGHGKPVQTQNGQWYMVYLCGRKLGDGYTVLGRETAMDPIEWTADGWPIVNKRRGPSVLQRLPELEEESDVQIKDSESTGFNNQLSHEWMFPREPYKGGYRIQAGKLYLMASREKLNSVKARNILVRRQKHFKFKASASMVLEGFKEGNEAGMICYYDEHSWLTFSIIQYMEGERWIRVVEHMGYETRQVIESQLIPEQTKKIILEIETEGLCRRFNFHIEGAVKSCIGQLEKVFYLSDEGVSIGKRFTGAMIGVYAYSQTKDWEAVFEWFNYEK